MQNYILYSIVGKTDQLNEIIYIYIYIEWPENPNYFHMN